MDAHRGNQCSHSARWSVVPDTVSLVSSTLMEDETGGKKDGTLLADARSRSTRKTSSTIRRASIKSSSLADIHVDSTFAFDDFLACFRLTITAFQDSSSRGSVRAEQVHGVTVNKFLASKSTERRVHSGFLLSRFQGFQGPRFSV